MNNKVSLLPNLWITLPAILLLSLGILVIYSSEPQLALQQGLIAVAGLVIYWILSSLDYNSYKNYTTLLYAITVALLAIIFIMGIESRGSVRWIEFGPARFQPSEFAKPVLILFLAQFWTKNLPTWQNIIKSLLWTSPILMLVFRQPDLGTALTLFVIWLAMLVGANISVIKLLAMSFGALIMAPIGWLMLRDYQKDRVLTFVSPNHDPLGVGYNVIQSVIAVGSGQIAGRGLGRGTQSRLRFLPEFRTDFVFASIAEEFGFIGSLIVLSLYGTIIGKGLMIAGETTDRYGSMLIFGVLGMLFFQIIVNIGMNIGIVPVTGITLPLLSYGGSSVVATLISLSFLVAVDRYGKRKIVVS